MSLQFILSLMGPDQVNMLERPRVCLRKKKDCRPAINFQQSSMQQWTFGSKRSQQSFTLSQVNQIMRDVQHHMWSYVKMPNTAELIHVVTMLVKKYPQIRLAATKTANTEANIVGHCYWYTFNNC